MDNYSHIVVGAGSVGCVVAARLASNPENKVLLIEAGPYYKSEADLPLDIKDASVPSQRAHDWGMTATGNGDRTLAMIRGRVVGGSSAVNACIALRAEPNDFKNWPEGWAWEDVLPYYKKLETDKDFPAEEYHGQDGPLPIQRWRDAELYPLSIAFLDASEALGYGTVSDHNKPNSTGSGSLPMNAVDERRISTADAYLRPVQDQENITVLSNAVADKVLFEGTKAVGISVSLETGIKNIFGSNIILSSGAFGTPAILLRSGVGPEEELNGLRIPVVRNLPGVGANLSDHSQVPIGVITKVPHDIDNLPPCIQVLLRYTNQTSGHFNDMQICLLNQVDVSVFTPYLMDMGGRDKIFLLTSNLMLPVSRGKVTLASVDPKDNPTITMDFCQSSEDVQRHRDGLRIACNLVRSDAFDSMRGDILESDALLGTDDELDNFIRERIQTAHHPSGTAKMGHESDPTSVVNSKCAVIGVEGLYVADASIIPEPVRANTNLTCIMIGERLSADLLAEKSR
jgi:choline dehydrogenase